MGDFKDQRNLSAWVGTNRRGAFCGVKYKSDATFRLIIPLDPECSFHSHLSEGIKMHITGQPVKQSLPHRSIHLGKSLVAVCEQWEGISPSVEDIQAWASEVLPLTCKAEVRDLCGAYHLLTFSLEEDIKMVMESKWSFYGHSISFHKWNRFSGCNSTLEFSKASWIRLVGLPAHLWNQKTFQKIGDMCGGLVNIDKVTLEKRSLQWARIRIKGNGLNLPARIDVEDGGLVYNVPIWCEAGPSVSLKDNGPSVANLNSQELSRQNMPQSKVSHNLKPKPRTPVPQKPFTPPATQNPIKTLRPIRKTSLPPNHVPQKRMTPPTRSNPNVSSPAPFYYKRRNTFYPPTQPTQIPINQYSQPIQPIFFNPQPAPIPHPLHSQAQNHFQPIPFFPQQPLFHAQPSQTYPITQSLNLTQNIPQQPTQTQPGSQQLNQTQTTSLPPIIQSTSLTPTITSHSNGQDDSSEGESEGDFETQMAISLKLGMSRCDPEDEAAMTLRQSCKSWNNDIVFVASAEVKEDPLQQGPNPTLVS